MPNRALVILTGLSVVGILVLDLVSLSNLPIPILYAVPVLLASLAGSALLVVAVSILVVSFDLIGIMVLRQPPAYGGLRLIALLIVCYLAVQIAGQRALIRRTVQVEDRAKWAMLIADIAHELRTPLTVVLGYSQLLACDPRLPRPLRPTVVTVATQAQQLRQAIDKIIERWKAADKASA